MNSKRSILIAGLVALAALSILCVFKHVGPIRTKMSAASLGAAGPVFTLDVQPATVILRGRLPDDGIRNVLRTLAGASFDPRKVVDSLEVVSGLVDAPWRQAALALLPVVAKNVADARLTFRVDTIVVSGVVRSEYQKAKLRQELGSVLPVSVLIDSMSIVHAPEALMAHQTISTILSRSTIEFQAETATVTDQGTMILDRLIPFLQEIRETVVVIEGHTDSRGDPQENLQLSHARADAVKAYLVEKGINAELLETKGYGATRPRVPENSSVARQRNRRVEFTLR